MKRFLPVGALLLLCLLIGNTHAVQLYQDNLGQTPNLQGWLLYGALGGVASQSATPHGVSLLSDDPASAGYSNTVPFVNTLLNAAFPILDRQLGFTLTFEMSLLQERHQNADRAGFSVILLGSDATGDKGTEGFKNVQSYKL